MKTVTLLPEQIHTGSLILINANHPYRSDATQQHLAPVNRESSHIVLHDRVVNVLSALMQKLQGWDQITAVSGWRSMEEQVDIFESSLRENGRSFTEKYVALPGHSEHQTGLAIDLALKQETIDFIRPDFPYTGICQRFRQQAPSYGFVERYPQGREAATGIAHEPWHFRYVGIPHAEIMAKHSFVLEEYLTFLKNYPYGISPYLHNVRGNQIMVSYLKANVAAQTQITIDDTVPYSISGNNTDGFIITQWRDPNGET